MFVCNHLTHTSHMVRANVYGWYHIVIISYNMRLLAIRPRRIPFIKSPYCGALIFSLFSPQQSVELHVI